ncbi:hypothetical protein GCM10027053_51760 [Intrasporangium mesophilum]
MNDCARGCLLVGVHVPLEDHPDGDAHTVSECAGCAPKPAEVGGYCQRCAFGLRDAIAALPDLIATLYAMPAGRLAPADRKSGDVGRRSTVVDPPSPSPAHDAADEAARWIGAWALVVADERGEWGPFLYRRDGIPALHAEREARYLTNHLAHVCAAPYADDVYDEARQLRHRLTRATGADSGDRRLPTRCPECNQKTLVRPNGTEHIECRNRGCVSREAA